MLALLNFDSVSLPLVERLMEEGRLPAVADLFRRGQRYSLESPGERFPAASYPVLHSGREIADHGIYYTLMWSPDEQRVRYVDDFPHPPNIWERTSEAGARVLVVDPYEAVVPGPVNGLCIAGWQFRSRFVLPGWSRPRPALRRLARRFGSPPKVEEILGTPSLPMLRTMRDKLLAAPARLSRLCTDLLARERFDLVWLTFSAAHLAGHQFWDLSQLRPSDVETAKRERLQDALADVYASVDRALEEVLKSLPDDADVILFSPLGMGANTSRVDLMPGMLRAVLSRNRGDADRTPGSFLWRLRGSVPTRLRARVADALPRRAVLELTARLETRGIGWSDVRAFVLPSDSVGYIRLNLRGRERHGTVDPRDAEDLVEEIVEGLSSFTDSDGAPTIAKVERISDVVPSPRATLSFPDLLVHWNNRPATRLKRVVSPRFGEVVRHGHGSGRSGNHNADAWAVVVSRGVVAPEPQREAHIADIAATVGAAAGVEIEGLVGRPLL